MFLIRVPVLTVEGMGAVMVDFVSALMVTADQHALRCLTSVNIHSTSVVADMGSASVAFVIIF